MDRTGILIINSFDIRKRDKSCNVHGCNKLPTKEAIIIESDMMLKRKRELASVYFCTLHYDHSIRSLLSRLNNVCEKGKIIDKKVFDIGYVTY
jgi:hypothetical protein